MDIMSALERIGDMNRTSRHVCFVPGADIARVNIHSLSPPIWLTTRQPRTYRGWDCADKTERKNVFSAAVPSPKENQSPIGKEGCADDSRNGRFGDEPIHQREHEPRPNGEEVHNSRSGQTVHHCAGQDVEHCIERDSGDGGKEEKK